MRGYKTLLFNILAAIIPVLEMTDVASLGLGEGGIAAYGVVVAIANIGLRFITVTPIFDNGSTIKSKK
jgi:hypothetical protein